MLTNGINKFWLDDILYYYLNDRHNGIHKSSSTINIIPSQNSQIPPCSKTKLAILDQTTKPEEDLRCDPVRIKKCGTYPASGQGTTPERKPGQASKILTNTDTSCAEYTDAPMRVDPFKDWYEGRQYVVQFWGSRLGLTHLGEKTACVPGTEVCPPVCYEILMFAGECWGDLKPIEKGGESEGESSGEKTKWDYDCMGHCGEGCPKPDDTKCNNWAGDCLRYDVCSFVYEEGPTGTEDGNCKEEWSDVTDDNDNKAGTV